MIVSTLSTMEPLTTKEKAFVLAYIGEGRFNATRAATMAGYSERTARAQGSEILARPRVAAAVRTALSERALTSEAVLAELSAIARAPWEEFVTVRTNPKTGEVLETRMDLTAKVRALELLAKAHGLLTDRVQISGRLTFADLHTLASSDEADTGADLAVA
jgi:phage terminase small subunit